MYGPIDEQECEITVVPDHDQADAAMVALRLVEPTEAWSDA